MITLNGKAYPAPVLVAGIEGNEYVLYEDGEEVHMEWSDGTTAVYKKHTVDRLEWAYVIDFLDNSSADSGRCICDFYSVILTTGCKCGGK